MQRVKLADIHQLEVRLVIPLDGYAATDGEIEVHDRELVGSTDHVSEHTRIEEVNATEREELETGYRERFVRGDHRIMLTLQRFFYLGPRRLHLSGLDIDPSHEQHVLVEDEVSLRLPPAHKQLGTRHLVRNAAVGTHHLGVKRVELG